MDKDLFTGVVMIDLRKAFNVVDHKLLLKKLQVYCLNTNSFKWFQSYLRGRYQKVCVDGKLSEPLGIHSGVPQGSILGPALFLLFINDLSLVLKNNIGIYADDSTQFMHPHLPYLKSRRKLDLTLTRYRCGQRKVK